MKTFKFKNIEISLAFKRHFELRYLPYGFGYDDPLFILSLFVVSFYIKLPFLRQKQTKDSDIDYGIHFFDDDEPHWFPDHIRISFGNFLWSRKMFYRREFFNKYYQLNNSQSFYIKDFNNEISKSLKYTSLIRLKNDPTKTFEVSYYGEVLIFKYKLFGKFINICPKEYHRLDIEYNNINENIYIKDSKLTCQEAFKQYCEKNNYEIL